MTAASGRQTVLVHGDQVAVVVEVGGGLRTYCAGGREMVDGAWDLRPGGPLGDRHLDTCFTLLDRDDEGRATVTLTDPGSGTAVRLWMDEAFAYLMLFTGDAIADPDRRRRGLAVEPMAAAPDALNSGDGLLVLQPGETTQAVWGIMPR